MNKEQPIGVFDSGVGGLTVAKEIKNLLPNESIIYFGDTAHLPYGDKSPETIKEYSRNITNFLIEQGAKSIVIACNSASSNALNEVREVAADRAIVYDVITPIAEKVAYQLHQNVGVIATKATVGTKVYSKNIRKYNKHIKVNEVATPLLVPIIEEGLVNSSSSKAALEHYFSNKKLQDIDTLILGCTHYPLMYKEINQYFGGAVEIIDSPKIVANYIRHDLESKNLNNTSEGESYYQMYVSDLTKEFQKQAKKFFGKDVQLEMKHLSSYET